MRFLYIYIFIAALVSTSCTMMQKDKDKVDKQQEEIAVKDLTDIKKRGKITVVFDNSSTSYFIYRGQPMGYEYELMRKFCKQQGLEMEIKVVSSIEQSFSMLNAGKADIIAYYLTVTKERLERVDFSKPFLLSEQVLVQRKSSSPQNPGRNQSTKNLIRNPVELIGKEVHVRQSSSYSSRLQNLSSEIGGDILIVEEPENIYTEAIIRKVAEGEFDYTVCDKDLALVNAAYYPNLDVETPLSFPQQIAWAVRKTSPELKNTLDGFIDEITKTSIHQIVYNKYFKVNRNLVERAQSEWSSITGSGISEYDQLLKQYSDSLGWDWMLLASIIYQESRFNPTAGSWAGAKGLMQLMPNTGRRFGAKNLYDPEQNIAAGTGYLKYLDNYWKKTVSDPLQRVKFVLASYNTGLGHVQDAQALARELGFSIYLWDHEVEECMNMKSDPQYFRNKVVKYGYCRGESVVKYVNEIIERYNQYKTHFDVNPDIL